MQQRQRSRAPRGNETSTATAPLAIETAPWCAQPPSAFAHPGRRRLANTRAFAAIGFALFFTRCATDVCGRPSPCPNDPRPTTAEVTQCRATLEANNTSPCFGEFLGVANCALDNRVCGGSGTTDVALTQTRVQNNCASQATAFQRCCALNPSASACR